MNIDREFVAQVLQRALHYYIVEQVRTSDASFCPAGMSYAEASKLAAQPFSIPLMDRLDYEGSLGLKALSQELATLMTDRFPCRSCFNGPPEPYGCTDCLNTGLDNGGYGDPA